MSDEREEQELDTSPTDRLTAESLEETARNFFAELDGGGETEESPSVEDDNSPDGSEGSEDDASSPSSSLPDMLDFGESGTFSKAEIENLLAFQQFVRDNPDVAEGIANLVTGKTNKDIANSSAPTTDHGKPYSDKVPEGLDLDDPAIKALWEEHLSVRSRLDQLQPMVETATKTLNTQQVEQAQTFLNRAKESIAKEFDLTLEDVSRIQDVAGRMNILPALMSPIDPVTNLPRKVDPISALESAFRTAYSLMPEFESKRLAKISQREQADRVKKKKLSSLAGSSGSVPKSTQAREPKNASERRSAMVAEVAKSMFGNNTNQ